MFSSLLVQSFFLLVSSALVHNLILTQFLGLCPFFGTSDRISRSLGMGLATSLVLTLSTSLGYLLSHWLLKPYSLLFLAPLVLILVISIVVQFLEVLTRFLHEGFYQSVGIFFPLITVNCAILGAGMLSMRQSQSFLEAVVFGAGSGLGFLLMLLLLSSVRERLNFSNVPSLVEGLPLSFISVAVVAMAFSGLSSLGRGFL